MGGKGKKGKGKGKGDSKKAPEGSMGAAETAKMIADIHNNPIEDYPLE